MFSLYASHIDAFELIPRSFSDMIEDGMRGSSSESCFFYKKKKVLGVAITINYGIALLKFWFRKYS